MNRRNLFAASLPLVLAAPAILRAQTTSGSSATGIAPTPIATSNGSLDAAQHKMMTLMVGTLSKDTSLLAIQRATDPRVKEFAGFENAEQTTIAQVLTNEANPPPAPLDATHQAVMNRLEGLQGAEFDRQYILGQIQGHQELLQIQQGYLGGLNSMAGDEAHVAMLARTVIQMHLTMLGQLQQAVHS